VLTLQGYRTLTTFGAADALSTLLGLSLYRELAPVLTALLFIGRAGSSIAAELGLMRATDQIKALELMAIDPVAKAVAPRFWAAVLTVPLLTGIFCSLAISASYFEAVHVLGLDNGVFWSALRNSVDFWDDFGVAMLKSAIFGGTAALVAAYVGFHAEPTIEAPRWRPPAVVNASLLVLMFNFVLSNCCSPNPPPAVRGARLRLDQVIHMAIRGPRLEFSVGAFLLLALASLMVLAVASTNQRWSWAAGPS
jgi:phospholipid/cholesterol/gamma-HCH transport system permease protein